MYKEQFSHLLFKNVLLESTNKFQNEIDENLREKIDKVIPNTILHRFDRDENSINVKALRKVSQDKKTEELKRQTVTIRVIDENKNGTKEFTCDKDLLSREMKYFSNHLDGKSLNLDDLDITVHCDLQIFDWLMKYVTRSNGGEKEEIPDGKKKKLKKTVNSDGIEEKETSQENNFNLNNNTENKNKRNADGNEKNDSKDDKDEDKAMFDGFDNTPNDIISFLNPASWMSVLVSAEFLLMDALVDECVNYAHKNLNEILKVAPSMNAISENVISRLSEMFTADSLEKIEDKKDKIRNKLFMKKLEKLLQERGSEIFKCDWCFKILPSQSEYLIPCLPHRTTPSHNGESYCSFHVKDEKFTLEDAITEVKGRWRDLYWSLWSVLNPLSCSKCLQSFTGFQLDQCLYHSESAEKIKIGKEINKEKYQEIHNKNEENEASAFKFPCCGVVVDEFCLFETTRDWGCKTRNHVTITSSTTPSHHKQIYDTMMLHKESFNCIEKHLQKNNAARSCDAEVNMFTLELSNLQNLTSFWTQYTQMKSPFSTHKNIDPKWYEGVDGDDDNDDDGDDNDSEFRGSRSNVKRKPKQESKVKTAKGGSGRVEMWDVRKSLRYNQDGQRQEDHRKMKCLVKHLVVMRKRDGTGDQKNINKHIEYRGGIYSRLECSWRSTHIKQTNNKSKYKSS